MLLPRYVRVNTLLATVEEAVAHFKVCNDVIWMT